MNSIAKAIQENIPPLPSMYPTAISATAWADMKRAELEHASGVAVRMNPRTFRVEYYRSDTGEIVSTH